MIPWGVILGIGGTLLGTLISLYIRDTSRETARKEYTELIVASLAVFKNELLATLDRDYRRSGECHLMMSPQEDRIDVHEKRLDAIDVRFAQLKGFSSADTQQSGH